MIFRILQVLFVATFFAPAQSHAESISSSAPIEIGVDYLFPIDSDRNIRTINLGLNRRLWSTSKFGLEIQAGGLLTYAGGDITQFEGEIASATFRETNHRNSAIGAGPGLILILDIIKSNYLTLGLYGSGHFIVYNNQFPAGGDYYNFMWQAGPRISFYLSAKNTIGLRLIAAHVSNGQGINPGNPSYDAHGISVSFSSHF